MYYILYGFLYLVSLIPYFMLYWLSDFAYLLVYYVFGYRKKVVMQNLAIAFPEKTEKERTAIAKQSYKNLIDTFLESLKLLSASKETLSKRAAIDFTELNKLIAKGKNLQLHSGHQMNWEYANWAVANQMTIPWIGVYKRIKNKAIDRLFRKLRSSGNIVLVALQDFAKESPHLFKKQYALGLIADQNARNVMKAYWLNFFDKPVAFVTGPDKGGRRNNPAIVFIRFVKLKRGYYRFEPVIVSENGSEFSEGEITRLYRNFLEETIRQDPANYLWTHRRWRRDYESAYNTRWVDKKPPPF
ncbi:MAG: lipid A biosynthesis acyltransferase [Ferruginibacter sp.]